MILIFGKLLGRRCPASTGLVAGAVAMCLMVAGCGDEASGADDGKRLVVATTTILGDVVANIVGDAATVEVLMPVGADPHDFSPSARQATRVLRADLVVANGLGLEEGLEDVLVSAAADGANVLEVAPMLDPIPFESGHDDPHNGDARGGDEHEDHGEDPHVWMDPVRMAAAADIIAGELTAIDATVDWNAAAGRYADELMATDQEIAELLAPIPADRRKLVTNHEALGYLAARHDLEVVGVVIPGGSTLSEPSPADLAALVEEIRHEGVAAIFAETIDPAALAEAVAADVGGDIEVIELYTDSLGEPGSGADTLIGMLVTNAGRIAEALG